MPAVEPDFYFETLYPFQDRVLQTITGLDTGFYLSGGTAASRGYLNHRFSDDLEQSGKYLGEQNFGSDRS